jgi:hypothetical protein
MKKRAVRAIRKRRAFPKLSSQRATLRKDLYGIAEK